MTTKGPTVFHGIRTEFKRDYNYLFKFDTQGVLLVILALCETNAKLKYVWNELIKYLDQKWTISLMGNRLDHEYI
jgi:hypothetical protein